MNRGWILLALAIGLGLGVVSAGAATTEQRADVRSFIPGHRWDPRMRNAQFEIADGKYLSAVVTLRRVEAEAPESRLPPEFHRLLADGSLGFGLPAAAEHSYRELAAHPANPMSLGKAQLDLATQLYNHGYDAKALDFLKAIRPSLPDELFVPWQGLYARVLLKLDRIPDAVTTYTKPDNGDDQTPFDHYNLAMALLSEGQTKTGVKQLDKVGGQLHVVDSDTLALRDKANLVLGYYYLRKKQANLAIHIFERVRIKGPYSNRALLGLGWAYLISHQEPVDTQAPAVRRVEEPNPYYSLSTIGALLRPGFLDEAFAQHRRIVILQRIRADKQLQDKDFALRRALVPWSELLGRDPMDPAVQEGMMAVPYALQQVGAHEEALEYYRKAIDALKQTRVRLEQAKRHVESDRMLKTIIARDPEAQTGWNWRLVDLPDAVETFYLQRIIAEHPYQEALKNYRDLKLLRTQLDTTDASLAALQKGTGDDARAQIPARFLIDRARQAPAAASTTPPTGTTLRLSEHLDSVSGTGAPPPSTGGSLPLAPPDLSLARLPAHFEGNVRRITDLRARIAETRTQVDQAIAASDKRLKNIALQALDAQEKTATRYLVEVRFAIARIYDTEPSNQGDRP